MKLEKKLPKEFVWKCQYARREKKKERARGGIVTDVRRVIWGKDEGEKNIKDAMKGQISLGGEGWWIATVYNRGRLRRS